MTPGTKSTATVDVAKVIEVMKANSGNARRLVRADRAGASRGSTAMPHRARTGRLNIAIMTAPAKRDPAVLAKLDAVAGRVLKR